MSVYFLRYILHEIGRNTKRYSRRGARRRVNLHVKTFLQYFSGMGHLFSVRRSVVYPNLLIAVIISR